MKPLRNILILVVVIGLLAGGLYAVSKIKKPVEEQTVVGLPETVTAFQTEKDNILSVTVKNPEEEYSLVKQGETWLINGNSSIKISPSLVETFLFECANVAASELIEENAQNLSQYGLDQPKRWVSLKLADGRTVKVIIGNATLDSYFSYLMIEGETKVYTKSTSGCETLTGPMANLADKNIYSMDKNNIGTVEIIRNGAETVFLDRVKMSKEGEQDAFQWTMRKPLVKEANTYRIESELLTNLVSQVAESVVLIPKSGVDYGFNNPRATYTITSLDKKEHYTVTVGKEDGAYSYIRLKNDNTIYRVPTQQLDFLSLSYMDLVDKAVYMENVKNVSEVTISGLGKSYTLKPSDNAINGKTVEESKFRLAYQAVLNLNLDDFATRSGGSVDFTITYHKNDGSTTIVRCLNYDDRNYLVTVNGSGNLLIRKKQIDNMITSVENIYSQS